MGKTNQILCEDFDYSQDSLLEYKEIISNYPFCSIAKLKYLLNLKMLDEPYFEDCFMQTLVSMPDLEVFKKTLDAVSSESVSELVKQQYLEFERKYSFLEGEAVVELRSEPEAVKEVEPLAEAYSEIAADFASGLIAEEGEAVKAEAEIASVEACDLAAEKLAASEETANSADFDPWKSVFDPWEGVFEEETLEEEKPEQKTKIKKAAVQGSNTAKKTATASKKPAAAKKTAAASRCVNKGQADSQGSADAKKTADASTKKTSATASKKTSATQKTVQTKKTKTDKSTKTAEKETVPAQSVFLDPNDLISKFLRKQPSDLIIKVDETKDYSHDPGAESLVEDMTNGSETLAKLYLKQGSPQKAIEIYKNLSLKNPQKSAYFASLISQIDKKEDIKE